MMENNTTSIGKAQVERNPSNKHDFGVNLNPMDLLRIAWKVKYWFVLSLTICMIGAWIQVRRTTPVYTRTASILIKDQSSGNRVGSEAQMFQEVGGIISSANVENELLIFKSERLSKEVVKRLNLQISYLYEDGLMTHDLYTESPVTVTFAEKESISGRCQITLLPGEKVRLDQFSADSDAQVVGSLKQSLKTPMGTITVRPSLFYNKGWEQKSIILSVQDVDLVARNFSSRVVAISAQKGSSVVNLTLNDVSPRRAEDFLNTLMNVYNEDIINDKNILMLNTDHFIEERLAILEKDLGGVEDQLAEFKQQNKMINLESEAQLAVGGNTQYQQEVFGLENQLQLVKMIREYLVDPAHVTELIPSNTGVSDMNLENQISQYNTMLLERDKLKLSSGEENPMVQEMNRTLEVTRQAMVRSVDNAIASLKLRIRNTDAVEQSMAKRMAQVPEHEKYMLSVERQQKVKEQLYVYLLQKREENALAQSLTESNARVIEPAKGSMAPISPVPMQIYLIALAIGLGLPIAVIVLRFMLNTTVLNRKDVEDAIDVPFLGDIPFNKTPKGQQKETIVVRADGKDPVTEAFRMLRTNIGYMQVGKEEKKVIMMTSMNPDSGKTFVIANLALMMAYAGKKVLLIDLDIRKGALTRAYGGKGKTGITHYLSGHASIHELVKKVPQSELLDIIYSGVVPPNPAEMLLSEQLDELVAEMKKRYDYILIDNVPAGVVADATIVNRLADMTIFVVRAGLLDKRQLPDVERLYQSHKLKNMAVLLNGVKEEHAGYGYYGYYGYGYSYGYGYHDNKKKKKKKFFGLF